MGLVVGLGFFAFLCSSVVYLYKRHKTRAARTDAEAQRRPQSMPQNAGRRSDRPSAPLPHPARTAQDASVQLQRQAPVRTRTPHRNNGGFVLPASAVRRQCDRPVPPMPGPPPKGPLPNIPSGSKPVSLPAGVVKRQHVGPVPPMSGPPPTNPLPQTPPKSKSKPLKVQTAQRTGSAAPVSPMRANDWKYASRDSVVSP